MKESTMQKSKRILDAMLQGRKISSFEANQIGNTTDGTRFIRFIREKYPVKSEKVEGELYHRYWIDEAYLAELKEVVAVAMSYWDNFFGTPEGTKLFSLSGTAGMHNKMFVKADEMRHKIRITKAWRENLQDISNEDCLAEGICYDEDRQEYFFFEDHEGEIVMETRRIYSSTPQGAYALLIDKVSGKGTWESNPEVTAYEFELLK